MRSVNSTRPAELVFTVTVYAVRIGRYEFTYLLTYLLIYYVRNKGFASNMITVSHFQPYQAGAAGVVVALFIPTPHCLADSAINHGLLWIPSPSGRFQRRRKQTRIGMASTPFRLPFFPSPFPSPPSLFLPSSRSLPPFSSLLPFTHLALPFPCTPLFPLEVGPLKSSYKGPGGAL